MSQSERVSQRCEAITRAGNRCKNRTARGKMCWIHLKKEQGLRVKESRVSGLGLYTTRRRRTKEKIATYQGERLTREQVRRRYADRTGEYVLCRRNLNECRDARKTNAGVARYANDPRGTGRRPNARFAGFTVRATKAIRAGSEILVPYGAAYWRTHGANK